MKNRSGYIDQSQRRLAAIGLAVLAVRVVVVSQEDSMRRNLNQPTWSFNYLLLFVLCLLFRNAAQAFDQTTAEELLPVGRAVVRLLETGDAKKFADEIAPTLKDWEATVGTNTAMKPADLATAQKQLDYSRDAVEASAQNVLSKAAALGLELSRAHFRVKEMPPRDLSKFRNPSFQAEGQFLPWVSEIEVVLVSEPSPQATNASKLRGEFRLALGG